MDRQRREPGDDESTADEEPTAVRETLDAFVSKKTAVDLRPKAAGTGLPRLRPASTPAPSTPSPTPKVFELDKRLQELRKQRVADTALEERQPTLRSGDKGGSAEPTPASVESPASRPARWPWLLAGAIVGGVLTGGGVVIGTRLSGASASPEPSAVVLQLRVQPANARVTLGDRVLPLEGTVSLPCTGPLLVAIEAPGHLSERHHLVCGSQTILYADLALKP